MHKPAKGDTSANRSNKCSNSRIYNSVSDRQYPPLIFHDLSVISPSQQNPEMCRSKVPTESVRINTIKDKRVPRSTSKENTAGASRSRGPRNPQIDRKRPSRFQPILPRTVLQPNVHNRQHVTKFTTPENQAKRSETTPTVSADMTPQSASILNSHNVNFYILQNPSSAVNDSRTVVSTNPEMLPKPVDQQVIVFTQMDQFGSAQMKIAGAPSNINCLTGNPFYYYNMTNGQPNVQLSLKGQETIDTAIQRCKRVEARNKSRAGAQDILQAADKLNYCREVRDDPVVEAHSKDNEPCDNRKSCILDIAEENATKSFKPDLVQFGVSPTNAEDETSDDGKAADESRVAKDLTLKRMIRPEQIMRPKRKYDESLPVDDSDEDYVDLTDLIKTSAKEAESATKSCADGNAKRRGEDAETAEILRRFPPTFMQDLFEDVSNSNPGSYVDAYATAMTMNEEASSSQDTCESRVEQEPNPVSWRR